MFGLVLLHSYKTTNKPNKRGANRRVTQNKRSGGKRSNQNVSRGMPNQTRDPSMIMGLNDMADYRRSSSVPVNIPKTFNGNLHWFKRQTSAVINSNTSTESVANFTFTLASLPDFADFTALFDQYCIVRVDLKFMPQTTENNSTADPGNLYTVIDHDDSAGLSSAQANEYESLVVTNCTKGQIRTVYPRVALAAYSGVFTSFANQRAWIDVASTGVIHYGLKTVQSVSTTNVYKYTVEIVYYLAFRDVR